MMTRGKDAVDYRPRADLSRGVMVSVTVSNVGKTTVALSTKATKWTVIITPLGTTFVARYNGRPPFCNGSLESSNFNKIRRADAYLI